MSKITDKIAALLQKTVENGATEQEAINAAKLAQRLMAKYHVEAVEVSDKTEDINDDSVEVTRNWQSSLAKVIADNTCCRVVQTRNKNKRRGNMILFFGRDSDRENAIAMWQMFAKLITKGIQAARRAAMARYGNYKSVEGVYALQYIRAIKEEMGEQCRALALVVPEDIDKAVAAKFPHLKHKRFSYQMTAAASMASAMGYRDGKSAASRKRLGGMQ